MANIHTSLPQGQPLTAMPSYRHWTCRLVHRFWAWLTQRTSFDPPHGSTLGRGPNSARQTAWGDDLPSVALIKVGSRYHVVDRRDRNARVMAQNDVDVELAQIQLLWQNTPR